jgi:CubicO group peptidase (beta-lactamase class C family)
MRTKRLFWLSGKITALVLTLGLIVSFGGRPAEIKQPTPDLKSIVDAFAGSSVAEGNAIGVAVAITLKNQDPQFFSYGLANFVAGTPVTEDTIFELGSVTKIFTTALLGEQVSRKVRRLDQPLLDFWRQLGVMKRLTDMVTLTELGDFTGGFPSLPPTSKACPTLQGALPDNNTRPTTSEYTAQDLLAFFHAVEPTNDISNEKWTTCNPTPTILPANYNYSDISTGLIGLLLGGDPLTPLNNQALEGWYELVNQKIKVPLGMGDTILYPDTATPDQKARLAAAYGQALATALADETTGQVSQVKVTAGGFGYTGKDPHVTILGGGGSGALAHATVTLDQVTKIEVDPDHRGNGYLNPPAVTFTGGNPTEAATADAVISGGKIAAIRILSAGSGYKSAPQAAISGGNRGPGARSAVLGQVFISNGGVYFVGVIDAGQGYVDPLVVKVEPEEPATNVIPIWAAAGSLRSTARDMIKLVQAALGHQYVDGVEVDNHLLQGFKIAEAPYACSQVLDPTDPSSPCIVSSGLAWSISRANGGLGEVISKNGGLSGVSTEIRLMPSEDLGVVVLVNSRQDFNNGKPTTMAGNISDNILAAMVRNLQLKRSMPFLYLLLSD